MRLCATIFVWSSLFCAAPALAENDAAAEAHNELEAKKAEANDAPATEEAPAAKEAPAEAAAEEPAKAVEPAPYGASEAPAVTEKIAKLNAGGQIVFALAAQHKVLKGAAAADDVARQVDAARVAGAFSVAGGAWVDMTAVRANLAAVTKALKDLDEKLEPLAEVDPTDGKAVGGKKKELLAVLPVVETLVGAAASANRRAGLLEGLGQFKLALDPPYAYGHSNRKIMAWTAASVGAMVTMAGVGSLSNPLEREQNSFGWVATGIGLTAAGVGAALIVLDDQ